MRHINTYIHPDITDTNHPNTFERITARAIVLRNHEILLIYTKYYDDYSLPGGGVDPHESIEDGLIRELKEETGAEGVQVIKPFGLYEEYRPYYKGYDQLHMLSYIYLCTIEELGEAKPEAHEIANGSVPVWIDINLAIKHNEAIIARQAKSMGLSVTRELELLKLIRNELIKK